MRLLTIGACALGALAVFVAPALADQTYQVLLSGVFSQNWTNPSMITVANDWTGVPGITGFRGDGLTGATGIDPQTVLADDSPGVMNVLQNSTNPNTLTTGGVAEFQIVDPTIALQGSGTATAPYIQLYIDSSGVESVTLTFNARDIDGSADNAVQPLAVQYRVGTSGTWTNLPAGFITDACTGPSLATLVTPVSVLLPPACDGQPQLQVRIMTTNAVGNDEWVGIDDLYVTYLSVPGATTSWGSVKSAYDR